MQVCGSRASVSAHHPPPLPRPASSSGELAQRNQANELPWALNAGRLGCGGRLGCAAARGAWHIAACLSTLLTLSLDAFVFDAFVFAPFDAQLRRTRATKRARACRIASVLRSYPPAQPSIHPSS
eukprot:1873784-Pleurochrysis_carterae.AAC.1